MEGGREGEREGGDGREEEEEEGRRRGGERGETLAYIMNHGTTFHGQSFTLSQL